MNSRSLRFRVIVWYAAWLSVVFVAFSALAYVALRTYLERSLRDTLTRRARQAAQIVERTAPAADFARVAERIESSLTPEASSRFVRVTRPDGMTLYRSGAPNDGSFSPDEVASATGRSDSEHVLRQQIHGGGSFILVVLPVRAGNAQYRVEVGSSEAGIESILNHFLVLFAIGTPVMILITVAGGYLLVDRALKPVDHVIHTAERISLHNPGERLPVPQTGDELQRLSLALNTMIDRLEQAFSLNKRFMADASHELRTPLTVMQSELEAVLEQSVNNPEVRDIVASTLEEVQRLNRIVDGLFALSRLDAGEAQQEFVRFDLGKLVATTADQMSLLAEDKNIKINCESSGPVSVEGDRSRLKQVMVNLLDNAIKYTPSGGRIAVNVRANGTKAYLEVADTGIGIPAEALPHVFERFYRVDKARTGDGGAGLGLSIVKSIAIAHGGDVRVQSREGEGSRFVVELPLAAKEQTHPYAKTQSQALN